MGLERAVWAWRCRAHKTWTGRTDRATKGRPRLARLRGPLAGQPGKAHSLVFLLVQARTGTPSPSSPGQGTTTARGFQKCRARVSRAGVIPFRDVASRRGPLRPRPGARRSSQRRGTSAAQLQTSLAGSWDFHPVRQSVPRPLCYFARDISAVGRHSGSPTGQSSVCHFGARPYNQLQRTYPDPPHVPRPADPTTHPIRPVPSSPRPVRCTTTDPRWLLRLAHTVTLQRCHFSCARRVQAAPP